jgi:hypothetical protein
MHTCTMHVASGRPLLASSVLRQRQGNDRRGGRIMATAAPKVRHASSQES